MSTYISKNATVVTYKKEDATVSTLFSNTEQQVHILADGCPLSLYKRLKAATIYPCGCTPLLYKGTHQSYICVPPHTDRQSYLDDPAPQCNAIKPEKKKETEK